MAYLFLMIAIVTEVFGTSLLKLTEGFTRLWPTVGCLSGYAISTLALSLAVQRGMNVSVGYAIWSGLGTTAIVLIGVKFLHQPIGWVEIAGIGLVIAGVMLLNLGGKH